MADLTLSAQPRQVTGRKVRQLRNRGLTPVVVYGKTQAAQSLQVDERFLDRTLQSGGLSRLVQVDVEGGERYNVLIRSVQRHPVSHRLLHADFYAVNLTEKQHVNVPIVAVGKPESFATGMTILQNLDSISVEALPSDIPLNIEVDVTNLSLDHSITVADLPEIRGVQYLVEPHDHVFTMIATRADDVAEVEVAAPAEPEVIAKVKKDEDEE
ncbi:50S ribosomal protein L25/general stress protein Ctc [soil metagenome]